MVQNSANWQFMGNMNLTSLYNKVPYFQQLNQKFRRTGRSRYSLNRNSGSARTQTAGQQPQRTEKQTYTANVKLVNEQAQRINHKLNTKKVQVIATDVDGKVVRGRVNVVDVNNIEFTPLADASQAMISVFVTVRVSPSISIC